MGFAYILMCFILGTTFLAIRVGVEAGIPPFLFAALRFFVSGLLLLTFINLRNRGLFPRDMNVYFNLAVIGVFSTTAVFSIVFFEEQYVPSFYVALLTSTMPIMILLIDKIFGNAQFTRLRWAGLALCLIGVSTIAFPGLRHGVPNWMPNTLVLLSAQLVAAIGAIKSRPLLKSGVSPLIVSSFQALFGSIGLFILSLFTEDLSLKHVQDWAAGLAALGYLILFGSITALTLYYWLVKKSGPFFASTWTYVSPVVAIIVGYLWYKEPVTILTFIGTSVILAGLFILNFREFQKRFWPRAGKKADQMVEL